MEQDNQNNYYKDKEELNVKEVIQKLQEFYQELIKNWHIIAGVVAFMLFVFLYIHFTTPITYSAKVKFLVEGEGGGGGGLASLARQFGLGGSTSGKTNPFKVIEVGQSNILTQQLLLHPIEGTLIGNKIIEIYNLKEKWIDLENGLENFQFTSAFNLDKLESRKAFNIMRGMLWGSEEDQSNALLTIGFNEERGVFLIRSKTEAQDLSVVLVNKLYEDLKKFFEIELLQNQMNTKKVLTQKVDSLAVLRKQKNYELATFVDTNRGLIDQRSQVRRNILTQDITAISFAYGEAMKNLELADISLQDIQPLFLQIEGPVPPLKPKESSLIRFILIALILGGFCSVTFIIGRKIFLDAMSSS